MHRHKHIIVGGGFGGLRTAKMLANRDDIEVTVINPQTNFEYHASLYRSANGYSPLETVVPYREVFMNTNVQYVQDFMIDIDPGSKSIKLLSGKNLHYDSATLALGYEPEYFGIPGMREFSKTLYSLADALELRKVLSAIAQSKFHSRTPVKIIVVGGGPTGIELAASIPHFFELLTGDRRVEVTLVEAQDRILKSSDSDFADTVMKNLENKIKIMCGQKVIRASKDLLHIANADPLNFDVLVWTAGSNANSYFRQRQDLFEVDSKGRVHVDEHLQTKHDGLYVIGDSAAVQHSGTAHAAIEMGAYVASHLISWLEEYTIDSYNPSVPPYAIPTDHTEAVAIRGNELLSGIAGWTYRRELDLIALLAITSEEVARSHWQKGDQIASFVNNSKHAYSSS